MSRNRGLRIRRIFTICCVALFAATIILTICLTYYLTEHYLQGDLSSDLVYANHLYETGRLVSKDWYGSTELRILRAEWVFAPLFAFFEDWHMVRFTGTLVMQGLIVAAFGYLIHQIRSGWNSFFLGASVLLVPYCFSYGVNVLYGCFYATFAAISFFSVALYVSLFHSSCRFRIGRVILLCALGFTASLGGPRIFLNVAAPMFLLIVYMNEFAMDTLETGEKHMMRQALWIGTGYVFCALMGYLINIKYLSKIYSFSNKQILLGFGLFGGRLDEMLNSLLYAFGFQNRYPLASARGLLALACAGVCALFVGISVKRCIGIRISRSAVFEIRRLYVGLMGFFALLVMVAFKAMTTDDHNNDTYYLLISMWAIPWAALMIAQEKGVNKKAAAVMILLILYASGLANTLSFVFPERFKQYRSVTFHHMELPKQMQASCDFLEKEGFTFGYSSFWHANVVTEMTDGRICVAGVEVLPEEDVPLHRGYWLTSKEIMENRGEKAFILLTPEEEEKIQQSVDMSAIGRIYGDEYFSIYEILDAEKVYRELIQ